MKGFALVLALLPLAASAAMITVNTAHDNTRTGDGRCTLREAIANVNAAADTTGGDCVAGSGTGDTITFSLTLPATVRLTPRLGELAVTQDLTIVGPASGVLAIDGRHQTRVFHITVGSTSMSNLTIQKGRVASQSVAKGGGILVESGATLQLANCRLFSNRAIGLGNTAVGLGYGSGSDGGGIGVDGTATLTNCTFTNNEATGGGSGGGIEIDGTATLTNCTFTGNKATGNGYSANINITGGIGGGIDIEGVATLTNCTVSGNRAVGYGTDSGDGAGGGVEINGTATLTNCMLSGNKAISGSEDDSYGGGIDIEGAATLTNCTLTGNEAIVYGKNGDVAGGGIEINGTATLTNCTLFGNKVQPTANAIGAGGIDGGTLTNTIIANSGRAGDCAYSVFSGGHNLSSDGTCFDSGGSDLSNTHPRLAPLANYGGPTQTLALCTGPGVPHASCHGASPAIDAGDDAVTGPPDNLTTDQRGLPRLSGAHVDIGAYEGQQ
jgi:hypothetical protein